MGESIRVLHVDDDPDFTDLAATFLERADDRFDVETEANAGDGLDRCTTDEFDCIVSDYDMPGQNGIEFLQLVREEHPNLPFILFTGKGSEEVASEAISAGVTDYLQKERGTQQYAILANRIENAVDGHRSQQALAERNQRLRIYERIFNTMREGAALYDAAGRFKIVNEYLADSYGTSRKSLEGEPSQLVRHIRERARDEASDDGDDPYQDLLDGERQLLRGEAEMVLPGKGRTIIDYQLTPLTIDGIVEGVVGVARDLTEHKERKYHLERAQKEYTELINGMNDTAWVIGLDERFLAVNDAAVEMLGYSRDELLSMTPHDIDAGLEAGEITSLIARMPEDEVQVFETVHETKDGERIPVEISSSLIHYRGEAAILSIARDISDRKERQERLEEFASVVSHDLRNPLTLAEGKLTLVRQECDSEHLEDVSWAHSRMNVLIDDLLQLARIGERMSETEAVDLPALVRECWHTVETGDATISIDLDRTIQADRSRLQQLLENLVRNSIEHGGESVTVTVGALDDGFYVEDDGPGIALDERDDVFETGYSTTEDGTGFGLSIVKQVVDAHGWDIRITEGTDGGVRLEITGLESGE